MNAIWACPYCARVVQIPPVSSYSVSRICMHFCDGNRVGYVMQASNHLAEQYDAFEAAAESSYFTRQGLMRAAREAMREVNWDAPIDHRGGH